MCVSIHEARNLEGVDCNPLLRVACKCGQQVKKTKSSKGSINPKFNEVSSFEPAVVEGWPNFGTDPRKVDEGV